MSLLQNAVFSASTRLKLFGSSKTETTDFVLRFQFCFVVEEEMNTYEIDEADTSVCFLIGSYQSRRVPL